MKNTIHLVIAAIIGSSLTLGVYHFGNFSEEKTLMIEHVNSTPVIGTMYTANEKGDIVPLDFTVTAENVMPSVVHIKSTQKLSSRGPQNYQYRKLPDPFRDFFGDDFYDQFFGPDKRQGPQNFRDEAPARVGSGSGVIINENGYIVTNNHVIDNADEIEVTLHDNKSYKATVIGTDPTTDLALIQIKEKNLQTIPLVNSDNVKIGEWVLAVGNPFNLNSTVTAGIVSAKARNINILREQYAIESFIQTDAAINPGNSGGALVNLQGGLIGINTAIASPTGSYSGYGFAVPSNMVNKVVEDLLKYGVVQRGYLGVTIRNVDGNLANELDLDVTEGVYVDSVLVNSAAGAAGVEPGDVILEVDGNLVKTSPELQELIARRRPGDQVDLKIDRKGKTRKMNVTLKNRDGNNELASRSNSKSITLLGADFEAINRETAKKLEIEGGVRIVKLYAGKLRRETDIREGFIITKIDKKIIKDIDDLSDLLDGKKGGVLIEGVYEDYPGVYYYGIGM
ncbi:MAG: Do family serine endopeptidase [Bacteroidetes bacterium]|nr:Do family serine endopeptidase [Bacteroidota bacterium]